MERDRSTRVTKVGVGAELPDEDVDELLELPLLVVVGERHVFIVADALRAAGLDAAEGVGREVAPYARDGAVPASVAVDDREQPVVAVGRAALGLGRPPMLFRRVRGTRLTTCEACATRRGEDA